MRFQIIQDGNGNNTGVFISMKEWDLLRAQYPEIALENEELQPWQKVLINERLQFLESNPDGVKPIDGLIEELNS